MLCIVRWYLNLFKQAVNGTSHAYLLNRRESLFWNRKFELFFKIISRINFGHVKVSQLNLVIAVKHLRELTERSNRCWLVFLLGGRVNIFFSSTSLAFTILGVDNGIFFTNRYFKWGHLWRGLIELLGVFHDFSQVIFRFRLFHFRWSLIQNHLLFSNYFILI